MRFTVSIVASFLVMLLVFPVGVVSAEQVPLTFEQFYEKVMAYYPRLKASEADVEIALARRLETAAGFLPTISVSTGYAVSDEPVQVFGMLLKQERFSNDDFVLSRMNSPRHHGNLASGVHGRWMLFDAFKTIQQMRISRRQVDASRQEEAFTRMEAFVIAYEAFTRALSVQRMLAAVVETEQAAHEDIATAEDLKEKGVVLGADFFAARAVVGCFTKRMHEQKRQHAATQALLAILMGETVDTPVVIAGTIPDASATGADTHALIAAAQELRPDLAAAVERLSAARLQLSQAKTSVLPTVEAYGDLTDDRPDLEESGGQNFAAGLTARMPLGDPTLPGRIKAAAAYVKKCEQTLAILKDDIARQIVEEKARFDSVRDTMPVVTVMATDANEAVSMTLPLYQEGRKSIVDLEQIRSVALEAVCAREHAAADMATSAVRMQLLTGELTDAAMTAHSRMIGGRNGEAV